MGGKCLSEFCAAVTEDPTRGDLQWKGRYWLTLLGSGKPKIEEAVSDMGVLAAASHGRKAKRGPQRKSKM